MRLLASVFLCGILSVSPLAAQGWKHLGKIDSVQPTARGVIATAGKAKIELTAVSAGAVRVRVSFAGAFDTRPSWAVIKAPENVPTSVQRTAATTILSLPAGKIRLAMEDGRLEFLDPSEKVIAADAAGFPSASNGSEFRVWRRMPEDEIYLGLGDKPSGLNNRAFALWNSDVFGWGETTDPLYKAIPFFLAFRQGRAYGTFLDNTWRTTFDFGKESRDRYSFGADGGELDYYFFFGPTPKDVVKAYADLTGKSPLPPLWSLGYQQCRYSYYPEARVREIANTFRTKKIPADVIYLDIDYQDGNRPFTVDRKRFPTFEQMIKDLNTQGFSVIAITDLHLKKESGYKPYDEGRERDAFVKNPDGSVYVGKVWPGDSVFPDFTLSRVREWWGTLYKDFVKMGIRGFWNDMNEPAVFRETKTMPLETRHRLDDGTSLDHRAIHNVFGMQNSRATYEGLLRLNPNERPNVLTRATYAGGQRYSATWTGDNSSTWSHYGMTLPSLLNLGISGETMVGVDIGGFAGSPPADLLTRWIELGTFNPLFRNHTAKGTLDQEPWVHGPEHEAIRRRYIELRYRLLPYIYTAAEEMARTGIPMMRPMLLEFPGEAQVAGNGDEYMFGHDLLVAPKLKEMLDAYTVAFPSGSWYDFWTGKKIAGTTTLEIKPSLDQLPVFVRGGAVIPQQPLIQHTGEIPAGPLVLSIYPDKGCAGSVYTDDGHTFDYKKGVFARFAVTCDETSGLAVRVGTTEGSFTPWFKEIEFKVFGTDHEPHAVAVDGTPTKDWTWNQADRVVSLRTPYKNAGSTVTIR